MTDGDLVGIFREVTQSTYDTCSDKRIFFDLPKSGEFDYGQVVIISETKHPIAPTVRIYGRKDPGTQIYSYTFLFKIILTFECSFGAPRRVSVTFF